MDCLGQSLQICWCFIQDFLQHIHTFCIALSLLLCRSRQTSTLPLTSNYNPVALWPLALPWTSVINFFYSELWFVFFVFFKWQPLLYSFFHFKTRASVCFACQYITTLLMVLGHTYTHSNRGQWYVCIFAFLLSFAFSCFGSLTCYYKDMKQYSHHTHTHAPFLLTVGLLHPPHRPLNQPTPSKHTHVKCSLWLLISRFALGLSGWHC